MKISLRIDSALLKQILKRPDVAFHATSILVLPQILTEGFRVDLNKGETTKAVYATQVDLGVNYNRDGGKTIKIPLNLSGLKLLDLKDPALYENDGRPSFQQSWYKIRDQIEAKGIFPKGYDGVFMNTHNSQKIHEVILRPDIATKCIIRDAFLE